MTPSFCHNMSALRKSRGLSQRQAAADLDISQALLSHYENGAREPGLAFVCRACDYYGVTADFILGRTEEEQYTKEAAALRELADELHRLSARADQILLDLYD
ncbi:MAG: helix-turn-helix domain-containing protein [Oscillospiraceae bacterium]|jgi:transcriptional regulator with XRE-family HTH domain